MIIVKMPIRVENNRVEEVLFYSRAEVEYVLNRLKEIIDVLGHASLSSLYNLLSIDIEKIDKTSDIFILGWTSLEEASINSHMYNSFVLKLPPMENLLD